MCCGRYCAAKATAPAPAAPPAPLPAPAAQGPWVVPDGPEQDQNGPGEGENAPLLAPPGPGPENLEGQEVDPRGPNMDQGPRADQEVQNGPQVAPVGPQEAPADPPAAPPGPQEQANRPFVQRVMNTLRGGKLLEFGGKFEFGTLIL